jgi:hypothetical protein
VSIGIRRERKLSKRLISGVCDTFGYFVTRSGTQASDESGAGMTEIDQRIEAEREHGITAQAAISRPPIPIPSSRNEPAGFGSHSRSAARGGSRIGLALLCEHR